jgi:hypothetical protein
MRRERGVEVVFLTSRIVNLELVKSVGDYGYCSAVCGDLRLEERADWDIGVLESMGLGRIRKLVYNRREILFFAFLERL